MSATARRLLPLALLPLALSACGEDLLGPLGEDDFTAIYESGSFQMCADCHAPGAPGFVEGTEATQDWSSLARAYDTLQGTASGMVGNFAGCNGVPFLADVPEDSLLVAIFDEDVRAGFSAPGFPDCDGDAISDHTLPTYVGPLPATVRARLDSWILDGAPPPE